MNLAQFPRRRYTQGSTPLERMTNLEAVLNQELNGQCPHLYIKRDDLLGLSAGGNKTRKLEFLVADALEKQADTLITCGAIQSNHARLTLSAAVKEGLKCQLMLEERVPGTYNPKASGNNFLYSLLGVEHVDVFPKGTNMVEAMQNAARKVEAQGRKPYLIPGGGSNEIGATGYVACAQELLQQTFEMGINLHHIVTASGSAGTHSGMLAGLAGANAHIPITGISVMRNQADQINVVYALVEKLAQRFNLKNTIEKSQVVVKAEFVGGGYSVTTPEMLKAVNLLAKTEGILLDPVYTGKAFAGYLDMIRKGDFSSDENVMFLHTGGSPVLFAYQEPLLSGSVAVPELVNA